MTPKISKHTASLMQKSSMMMPLAVFLLSVVVHLVVIGSAFWQEQYAVDISDEPRYVFYAESIRAGQGMHAPGYDHATAYVMPAVPVLFAAIGPDSLVRLRTGQLVLCGLIAVVTYLFAKRLSGDNPYVAWIAVIMLLANLGWVLQPVFLMTEPLFTLCLLLATFWIACHPEDWRYLAGAGIALGLAWLTRGALIGPLLLIFPCIWWRSGFRKMMLVGVVMGIVISPWVIRNYIAFGTPVATSSQSGNVLAGAYNDEIYKNPWGDGWVNPDELYKDEVSEEFFNDEIAYSNYLAKRGREWILDNPEKLPKLMAAHVFGFVRPWPKITRNDTEFLYELFSWSVGVVLITIGGIYAVRQRHQPLIFAFLIILGGFITGLIFFAIPRYRLPFAPLFALIEAAAVWQIWLRLPKNASLKSHPDRIAGESS